MKTSASEHLSHAQVMSRLAANLSALIKEQIDAVERFLSSGDDELESSEMAGMVELAVRLVERSAEWLGVTELATLALELRETLVQIGQLRTEQRQEMIVQCRVALTAEARLADKLRTDGFGALVQHAGVVTDAVEQLRTQSSAVKAQEMAASRGVIDEGTPDVGPSENLLALTFEIKNALMHQNDRIASMSETVGDTMRAAHTALGEWEGIVKRVERRRMQSGGKGEDPLDGKALLLHQGIQETTQGLRALSHELGQLMSLQYALERRARDLDETLLWEFLDPLDRFVEELYRAASSHDGGARRTVLTLQTGGVGFEPEIGSILLPILVDLLESAEPCGELTGTQEIRLTAAREGLEARIAIEGACRFSEAAEHGLEAALAGLGGFATISPLTPDGTSVHLQFPMARSLRSFLIVEAAGQRIALPWSAVERLHASPEDLAWDDVSERTVHSLATLFTSADRSHSESGSETDPDPAVATPHREGHPVAVLRSGGESAVVGFDRIVWRENARLTPLPPRLYPVREIMGGIVAADNSVTLVLNPAGVLRRFGRSSSGDDKDKGAAA
jgi:hypothetical protein